MPPAGTLHSSTRLPCSRHTGCPSGLVSNPQLLNPPGAHTVHSHTHLAQGDEMPIQQLPQQVLLRGATQGCSCLHSRSH
jgi:hypothetical protein